MPERRDDTGTRGTPASQPGDVLGVGLQFALSIVLFLFVGRWLDEKLGTAPWLLLAGVMIGAAAGFYSLYRQLVIVPRERERRRREEEKE
jgi:F0F1-type ATP synthase assembly protein I